MEEVVFGMIQTIWVLMLMAWLLTSFVIVRQKKAIFGKSHV